MENKIKIYQQLLEEFDTLADKIMFKACVEYSELLDKHIGRPTYEIFEIDDKNFNIKYYDGGYDLYDCNWLSIPIKHIIDNTWEDYLKQETERIQTERYKQICEQQDREKQQRYETYKQLKDEFETDGVDFI